MSGLELGGLAGSLSSGFLADYLTRKNTGPNPKGNVGIRVQVLLIPARVQPWLLA